MIHELNDDLNYAVASKKKYLKKLNREIEKSHDILETLKVKLNSFQHEVSN